MFLLPRQGHLPLRAERQDVVFDEIVAPVVLVKSPVVNVVNEIIFKANPRASFIRIKPPSAITRRVNIVDDIVAHRSAFRFSEGINATHVAQDSIPEVM